MRIVTFPNISTIKRASIPQVNRDPASLIALIAVKPNYPDQAPVFCLNLHWRGVHNQVNHLMLFFETILKLVIGMMMITFT